MIDLNEDVWQQESDNMMLLSQKELSSRLIYSKEVSLDLQTYIEDFSKFCSSG